MRILIPSTRDINHLLEKANSSYVELCEYLEEAGNLADLEELLYQTGQRVYTLHVWPFSDDVIKADMPSRKPQTNLIQFGFLRSYLPNLSSTVFMQHELKFLKEFYRYRNGMRVGNLRTDLSGNVTFVGAEPSNNALAYWERRDGELIERVSDTENAQFSGIHLVVSRLDDEKLVVADVGETPLIFREASPNYIFYFVA